MLAVRRLRPTFAIVLAVMALAPGAGLPFAQSQTTEDLLRRYAQGEFDVVSTFGASRNFKVASIDGDLEKLTQPLFKTNPYRPADPRRLIAAFVMEVANAGLLTQIEAVNRLLLWTRTQLIDPHTPADDFDRRWHHFEIVLQQIRLDAAATQDAAISALRQFPHEPRFILALAWVEERKLAAATRARTAMTDDMRAQLGARFDAAIAQPGVRGEAELRLGRIEWSLRRDETAITWLDAAVGDVADPELRYLAHLFRGQALSDAGRSAEAASAFRKALDIVPGAQSATLALATQLMFDGARQDADILVHSLLTRPAPAVDPWWMYTMGDAPFGRDLLAKLRAAIKP